jgi:hypothetical protein
MQLIQQQHTVGTHASKQHGPLLCYDPQRTVRRLTRLCSAHSGQIDLVNEKSSMLDTMICMPGQQEINAKACNDNQGSMIHDQTALLAAKH